MIPMGRHRVRFVLRRGPGSPLDTGKRWRGTTGGLAKASSSFVISRFFYARPRVKFVANRVKALEESVFGPCTPLANIDWIRKKASAILERVLRVGPRDSGIRRSLMKIIG